jgi:hypothetical protein
MEKTESLIINMKLLYISPAEHVFWEFITIFFFNLLHFFSTSQLSLTDVNLMRQWQFSYFTCHIFSCSWIKAIIFIRFYFFFLCTLCVHYWSHYHCNFQLNIEKLLFLKIIIDDFLKWKIVFASILERKKKIIFLLTLNILICKEGC